MPFAVADYKEVIKNICAQTVFPLDIEYALDENGDVVTDSVNSCIPVKSWDEWVKLPIRDYDEYVTTPNHPVRLPTVVVCENYKKMAFERTLFPTNRNIWERDNYTCAYTLKKLQKSELSVDHIIPTSRGGEDTWLNKVTCDRELNSRKGSKTPEEAGLKLKFKPTIPTYRGVIIKNTRPEWAFILEPFKK